MTLRNREYVQGKSATKGYVQDINLSQAFEQSGRNANVRKQEMEMVVSVVLIIDSRATWHGCGRLETENAVCIPVRAGFASRSTVHRKKTGCDNGHCGSRNSCRKLLFGDGTVEDTLDGGPSVSDSYWWVVNISQ